MRTVSAWLDRYLEARASEKQLLEAWQNDSLVEGAARSIDEFSGVPDHPEMLAAIESCRSELSSSRPAGASRT